MQKVATGTPSHVPPRRRGIIIAIFHDFGTNSMVPRDWDSAPRCVCGPDFISDLIGESPIFPAASVRPANRVGIITKSGTTVLQSQSDVHQTIEKHVPLTRIFLLVHQPT